MAKRRTKKISTENIKETEVTKNRIYRDISERIRLDESYVSLILGAVVVFGLSVVAFLFIREGGYQNPVPTLDKTNIPQITVTQKTYVLKDGESLWDVAVKFYGDGYRYVDIINANKLENPDYVPPGTRLIIPNAK